MSNPVTEKLSRGADLSAADRGAITKMISKVRRFGPRQDVIREGDAPENVHAVLKGFACRYKTLPDGGRQIMAFLVPGDFCDLHVAILGAMDHNIATLSACDIALIGREQVEAITSQPSALNRALWWATLVDEAVLREWMVGMGRRPAHKQIAHLFCELLLRLQTVGLAPDNSFEFTLTQEELADAVGMSAVHVNRVLQQLRQSGLLNLSDRTLTVLDLEGLKRFSDFDPNYLHLGRAPAASG